ncbi:MAG: prolipoprotein diacylglyceryl transferase family protein [Candidatus Limnocylindrales bacterium]
MPIAAIVLDFDPILRFGGYGVRWETLGIAGSVLVGILLAAVIAGRTAVDGPATPAWARGDRARLRRDDLLFIVLGAVPGAAVGGRIGYVLLHRDFYAANSSTILDPGQGSLELSLALVGATITGAYVARLLDAPVGRWLHAAVVPVFLTIGLGELARVLGGSGQGASSDASWALAYGGAGPWGSLGPAIPAHPAQVYGAIVAGLVLVVVGLLTALGGFRARDGSVFLFALLIWALGRAVVSVTWRDDPLLGPLPAGGALALGVASVALASLVVRRWTTRRRVRAAGDLAMADRPDPTDLPRA